MPDPPRGPAHAQPAPHRHRRNPHPGTGGRPDLPRTGHDRRQHHPRGLPTDRISQLVTDLDPKLTAAALGMHDTGLVRYLADNVDNDRLQRNLTNPGASGPALLTFARTCASNWHWHR